MGDVACQIEPSLSADEFVDVLRRSTLAERRPVADAATIAVMLAAGLPWSLGDITRKQPQNSHEPHVVRVSHA
jgi:hypothetical protein